MDVLSFPTNSSLANAAQPQLYPYAPSISSSASSSSSSVFSVDCPSSQGSVSSFSSASVDGLWETGCAADLQAPAASSDCLQSRKVCGIKSADVPVPPELRQNPRRTRSVSGNGSCTRPPPSLVRQCERKVNFVDSLVDSAAQIVESIWPLSVIAHNRSDAAGGCKAVLPLRVFIQETLRRSRTSYSTLQVALYYLILIKDRLPRIDFTMEQPRENAWPRAMQCGRRMFLSALILASKYLQDRNYSARAWSKISGLSTAEINQNEWAFLEAVDWKLHISEKVFQRWTDIVLRYTPNPGDGSNGEGLRWGAVIPLLTPELDTVDMKRYHRFQSPTRELFGTPSPCHTPVPHTERVSAFGAHHVASNDQTPTDPRQQIPIPSTLEPNPNIDYSNVQLPSLPKLGLLPTPQMTPQSTLANTPAVSVNGFDHCRPSIGVALHRAKSMSVQRSTLDRRPACLYTSRTHSFDSYSQCRRSSLARSTSSSSSPESMISDVPSLTSSQSSRSSRSSRSSSVSSTTSGTCAPFQSRVAGRSIRRCANLPTNCLKDSRKNLRIATPIDESNTSDIYASPESLAAPAPSLPDLSNFSLGTPDAFASAAFASAAHEAAQGLCELSGALPRSSSSASSVTCNSASASPSRRCRKRGRTSSEDTTSLHQNVRHLMALGGRANEDDSMVVLADNDVADSFLLPQSNNTSSAFSTAMKLPLRLALPAHPGSIKRTCCGNDAAKFLWNMRRDVDRVSMADELD